jgi:hypothetical protein
MNLRMKTIYLFIGMLFILTTNILGQQQTPKEDKTLSPSQEEFKDDDGVIDLATRTGTKMMYQVTGNEIARLYNSDVSVWWEFSYNQKSPYFLSKVMKPEIKRFGTSIFSFRVIA